MVKELVDYRARNNLSQRQLAELLGMTTGAIYLLENNKRKARKTTESKMYQLLEKERRIENV